MFRRIKIGAKITLLLLTVVVLSVFAIGYLSYNQNLQALEKSKGESFKVISSLKAQQIESLFEKLTDNISFISTNQLVVSNLAKTNVPDSGLNDSLFQELEAELDYDLVTLQKVYNYANVLLTNIEGKVVYKSLKSNRRYRYGYATKTLTKLVSKASEGIYFASPFNAKKRSKNKEEAKSWNFIQMYTAAPVLGSDGKAHGYVIILYDLSKNIYPILKEVEGLGETGEVILCENLGRRVKFISSLKGSDASPLTVSVYFEDNTSIAAQRAVKGEPTDYAEDIDHQGKETLASWANVPSVGWGVVVKEDKKEILSELDVLVSNFVKYGLVIVALSFLISIFFSQFLTAPILLLRKKLNLVAQGILPENVRLNTSDEIGEMAVAVTDLVKALKRTANFATHIGKGNFNAEFQPLSKVDTLGNALLSMRDSIKVADIKEKERNWIVSGVAELGQILRTYNEIDELGEHVISFLTEKIGAVQGAFYVMEKVGDLDKRVKEGEEVDRLKLVSSYAYSKKKYLKAEYRLGESLVGQTALEKEIVVRTEIPNDYLKLTSGLLEEKKPTSLLFIPLITDEEVYGVLEFAALQKFEAKELDFLDEISVIVARTVFNIKVNERTVKLLQESQKMSEELKIQQEELRKNAEEMALTQKKLKRANFRLEDQIEEVNRTQKRMQLLLENASEIITIFERNTKIRYISPSVEPILGYTQFEMIGTEGASHVHPDNIEAFQTFFEKLLERPNATATIQYEYLKNQGETVWLEANGRNLLDDPAVKGVVVNSRDITERRRAEQEERMRSQMQALSENSPDLIKRFNNEGVFFYINPTIRTLTGRSPEYFLNKHISEIEVKEEIKSQWQEILNQVGNDQEQVSLEMEFPTDAGERVMQVNAIPEFSNGQGSGLESVLIVSHDITEQKQTEMEVRSNNKKITESINYAKRIQSAILPNNEIIKALFPESFILYRPRDVVSGDFPWFMQHGDDVLMAAVDCTGHGVPGALISLIGYFILNDIVNSQNVVKPGVILDKLNEGVTKTLRQDTGATTRDGMDISLIRVNRNENFLEYAGAHRPLYYTKGNDIEQLKGDRFPIGGGKYKTRTDFTTQRLDIEEGMQIYMFSDGLPDQFGGVQNKKFGTKRIREAILNNQEESMEAVRHGIKEGFLTWMGDKRQTDDVLLIGIQF